MMIRSIQRNVIARELCLFKKNTSPFFPWRPLGLYAPGTISARLESDVMGIHISYHFFLSEEKETS